MRKLFVKKENPQVKEPNHSLFEIGQQIGHAQAKRAIMHLLGEMEMPQLAVIVGKMDVSKYLAMIDEGKAQ